jgi:hypothetical protein
MTESFLLKDVDETPVFTSLTRSEQGHLVLERLSESELAALESLVRLYENEGPIRHGQWKESSGINENTFKSVRRKLLEKEVVKQDDSGLYLPSEQGRYWILLQNKGIRTAA